MLKELRVAKEAANLGASAGAPAKKKPSRNIVQEIANPWR
jgi:hypothetical protein